MDAERAITNLIFAYAERIDAGDYEGVADLFAAGRITAEGTDTVRSGRDEILAMYRQTTRIHEDTGTPRTKHVTTNLIIDVDDESDTARARSYFTVLQAAPGLDLQPVIAGRYHDRFERSHGSWCFTERHIICDLFGDLSHHLL
ncbi:MAG: nuclear transport factor 2 family protein [Actinobacteria bacterium]|nr:MAG: nuclear transport factor 2 family protein [Actinomycetota bacterium]